MRGARAEDLRRLAARLAVAVLAVGLSGAAARPAKPARAPAGGEPIAFRFETADHASLAGRWYAADAAAGAIVLAPRERGFAPQLDTLARALQRRGFDVLTFALRDSVVADRSRDSLGMIAMTSRWVTDLVGAIHAARARTDSAAHLFVWGQGTGGDMALAAVARDSGASDGVVVGEVHRLVQDAQRELGTSQIPEAYAMQRSLIEPRDEPTSAAARLRVPVYAILVGSGAGGEDDVCWQVTRRARGRVDRWIRPGVAPGRAPGAAEADTVSDWLRRMSQFPRAR